MKLTIKRKLKKPSSPSTPVPNQEAPPFSRHSHSKKTSQKPNTPTPAMDEKETRSDHPLKIGDEVLSGRYRIEGQLGEGNFGQVYRVREIATDTLFAMKRGTVPTKQHLYESEIQKLTTLQGGPHILPLHDHGFDAVGNRLILTEYLDGGTLKQAIQSQGTLTEREALAILGQMAKAVAHAHQCDPPILHRDIKPSNILAKRMGKNRVKWYLADWGLAASFRRTHEPEVSGTYSYTAPEVWRKKRYPVSDVYSLGMTLYFMIFGRPAYEGNSNSIRKMQKIPKPVVIPTGCPDRLKTILSGMLAKNPKKRWSLPRVMEELFPQEKKKMTLTLIRRLSEGKTWRAETDGVCLDFCWIPGGTFPMGHSKEEAETIRQIVGTERYHARFACETPQHAVELDGFWMCRTPITRSAFFAFQKASGYRTAAQNESWFRVWDPDTETLKKMTGSGEAWRNPGFEQEANHPIVNISYGDVLTMAEWLSRRVHRLIQAPSEAQWEYACRGGTEAPYAFGAQIHSDQANFDGRSTSPLSPIPSLFRGGTTPVETFQSWRNRYGLLDLHGNVFEWTRDWYEPDYYAQAPNKNPRNVYSSYGNRVIRGGSWLSPALRVRSRYRDHFDPADRDADIGFRLVALAYPWER